MNRASSPVRPAPDSRFPAVPTVRASAAFRALVLPWSWPDLVIWWPRLRTP
jgi:hypothetical protein